jgi:hypothetical protein
LNFDSIYAYDHLVPHYKDDVKKYFWMLYFTVLFSCNYTKSKDRTNSCMQFLSQSGIASRDVIYIGYCK